MKKSCFVFATLLIFSLSSCNKDQLSEQSSFSFSVFSDSKSEDINVSDSSMSESSSSIDSEHFGDYLIFDLLEDNTYEVSAADLSISGSVYIPESYNGKPVTAIKEEGFKACTQIQSISLPETITIIKKQAFAYSSIYWAKLPNSILTIEEGAFLQNRFNNPFIIPDSLNSLGKVCFANCQIEGIVFGNGLKTIPDGAFSGNYLTELTIPDNLETIESGAFASNLLTSIHIGKNLETILGNPFANNYDLDEITIDSSNHNFFIENDVLYSKNYKDLIMVFPHKNFDTFVVPDNTETIHASAFVKKMYSGNSGLKTLTLGENLKTIERSAFALTRLEEINMNDKLVSIGDNAFSYTPLKEVLIPDSVFSIGMGCFQSAGSLETVKLPSGLETISQQCFEGTTSLTDILIPRSIKSIRSSAFKNSTTSLSYEGTMEEWGQIEKSETWTNNNTTVICSDGIVNEVIV